MLAIAVAIEKAKWYQQKSNSNKSKKLKYNWNHFQKEPHEGHIWALGPDFGTTYSRNDGWWWTFFLSEAAGQKLFLKSWSFEWWHRWLDFSPTALSFKDTIIGVLTRLIRDVVEHFIFSSKLPVHMYLKLTGVMKGRGNSRGSALKETDRQINIFPDWTEELKVSVVNVHIIVVGCCCCCWSC